MQSNKFIPFYEQKDKLNIYIQRIASSFLTWEMPNTPLLRHRWRNNEIKKTKLRGLSLRVKYTNRTTAACRRS
jgi:hypothetical protein